MVQIEKGRGELPRSPGSSLNLLRAAPAKEITKSNSITHRIYHDDRKLQWVLLVFMVVCYGALFSVGYGHSARTSSLRLVFNSMAAHLMHGRFDVDLATIGVEEGFERDGRYYAYFGIFPALLRIPLWFLGRMDIDLTMWSCLAASCLAGLAKVRTVLLVRRHGLRNPMADRATGLMLIYVLLGGVGTSELNASMYQEVILWAGAFGAVFVYLAVKGVVNQCFGMGTLCAMAVCAGLALLSRVTGGIGLILAFVLLLLAIAAFPAGESSRSLTARRPPLTGFFRAVAAWRTIVPAAVLAVLMAATGAVNYFRWGNPTIFANWEIYLAAHNGWPEFLDRMHAYGAFNIVRIPFNFGYYFFPIWALHAAEGPQMLNKPWTHTMIGIELPPASFLLTDMFAFCFIALLAVALWKRRPSAITPSGRWATAIAIGLFAPCFLMLTAIWVAFRYRTEFFPEIEFLAFLGLFLTVTNEKLLAYFARFRKWMAAAVVISIMSSLFSLALTDVGQPLPPQPDPRGLVHYYLQVTADHYHKAFLHQSAPQQ